MLKLEKTIAAVVLGLGCAAGAQAVNFDMGEFSFAPGSNEFTLPLSNSFEVSDFSDGVSFSFTLSNQIKSPDVYDDYSGKIEIRFTSNVECISSCLKMILYEDGTEFREEAFFFNQPGLQVSASFNTGYFPLKGGFSYKIELLPDTLQDLSGMYYVDVVLNAYGDTAVVPEPAEYAMLLAGLSLIGIVARRRKMNVN
jgi:hypothetical protein